MKENFNVKGKNGAIAIFVLVGLLFMTSFLIISYGYNVNKSKTAKEQFNIISDIYSHKDGDANAYERAYTALRKQNKQTLTKTVENSSTLELEKTYEENLVNYRIYGRGNSVEPSKVTITDLTNQGFLPSSGAYPDTTDTRFPNATYEIIDIKKGQTFKFDYTGTNGSAGDYTTIGYIRVRCIDATTNEVVCDLVHNSGESITENDYYTTNLYYTYSTQQTDGIDGYVTAKKDFKIGIMYLLEKPDDFCMEIERNLPEGYQQVEYIESTGTQYINTGYYPNLNTKAKYKVFISEYKTWGPHLLSSNKYYFPFLRLLNDGEICAFRGGSGQFTSSIIMPTTNTIYEIEAFGDGKIIINGQEVGTLTSTGGTDTTPLYLGTYGGDPSNELYTLKGKIYYCKIWDGEKLEREFVPCYRKQDNVVGLYDIVNGVFYTNQGIGEFSREEDALGLENFVTDPSNENYGKYKIPIKSSNIEGESVTKDIYLDKPLEKEEYIDFKTGKVVRNDGTEENIELPDIPTYEDYTKIEVLTEAKSPKIEVEYLGYILSEIKGYTTLEYIESTGTQYINTGYYPDINTNAKYKVFISEYKTYGPHLLSSNKYYFPFFRLLNGGEIAAWRGSAQFSSTDIMSTTNTIYEIEAFGDGKIIINGQEVGTLTSTGGTDTTPLYLGTYGGNPSNQLYTLKGKIYYCKIWDGETLVRDFVPCKGDVDGEIGLYDKVNNKFYSNDGTDKFIAGPKK